MPERPRAFRTFAQDLAHALRVWRSHPRLPLLALAIEGGPYIVTAVTYWLIGYPACNSIGEDGCGPLLAVMPWVTFVFTLVFLGWYGTERIWYLRAFRGQQLDRSEFWPLTSAFRGRFFVLGVLAAVTMVPALFLGLAIGGNTGGVVFIAWMFAVDAALTFVTPALSFSTGRVFEAIRIGFKLARQAWPASALYIFIPPLALRAAAASFASQRSAVVFALVADTLAVLLLLWFRGATARFYLRFIETGENGAAFRSVEGEEEVTR